MDWKYTYTIQIHVTRKWCHATARAMHNIIMWYAHAKSVQIFTLVCSWAEMATGGYRSEASSAISNGDNTSDDNGSEASSICTSSSSDDESGAVTGCKTFTVELCNYVPPLAYKPCHTLSGPPGLSIATVYGPPPYTRRVRGWVLDIYG